MSSMTDSPPPLHSDSLMNKEEVGALSQWFRRFSVSAAKGVGNKWAFIAALLIIIGWAATGPIFHFSDTWQLIINTGTTIVTFLMVFLIQNTQNRDAKAIHLKLDELIRAVKGARTRLVNLEESSDDELEALHLEFERVQHRAQTKLDHMHRTKDQVQTKVDEAREAAGQAQSTAAQAEETVTKAKNLLERVEAKTIRNQGIDADQGGQNQRIARG